MKFKNLRKRSERKAVSFPGGYVARTGAGFYTMKHEERERPGEGRYGSPAAVGPLGSKI